MHLKTHLDLLIAKQILNSRPQNQNLLHKDQQKTNNKALNTRIPKATVQRLLQENNKNSTNLLTFLRFTAV